MTTLHMPPVTGPLRIDALAGHTPSWRPDHGEEPLYQALVAEYGPPGLLVGPAGRETLLTTITVSGRHT